MTTGFSSLDFKLGLRMLVRYPGLTGVGGLAIAFAIWVGAGTFEVIHQLVFPKLPLEQGERIVGVKTLDRAAARSEIPTLHDFARWAAEARTVEEMGAFRHVERNLITGDGNGEPVEVAEVGAAAFRVARAAPLHGRPLVAEDEAPGAAPVVVLSHDLWRRRFGGDPGVVGREVRLGRSVHTVVGVMPEGYGFPVDQALWVPLHLDPLAAAAPGESPRVRVFGRLAPGATLEEARAEFAALGERMAADAPETHGQLRPRVLPYPRSILEVSTLSAVGVGSINLFLVMLLVLVCGNVALLTFARAATRERELVLRGALGATRGRIVGQLFAEALVLAALGAAVGLAAVEAGLEHAFTALRAASDFFPFWLRPRLSAVTVAYTVVLTVLAALVAGGLPGLKATRGLRAGLQRASAGGGGFRFGGVWTAVIVAQVAVTVAFPVFAYVLYDEIADLRNADAGFPDERYLSVRVEMDPFGADGAPLDPKGEAFRARYAAAVGRLAERFAAEPGVERVAFGESLPRLRHPDRWIEVEIPGAASKVERVTRAAVAPDFFAAFDAPVLAGRG
ncbi:MAG TPA: ABC transporter permease, partial [Longimicrobium sp.]|nr:ABC transporter permease [Longimicrobium sp.]